MHASDSGYQRYINEWEGIPGGEMLPFNDGSGFAALSTSATARSRTRRLGHRPRSGHAVPDASRSCRSRTAATGCARSIEHFEQAYELQPQLFEEDPVEVLQAQHLVHPFHEEDPKGLIDLVGADHVLFGSDYPHPEGMSDPITLRRRPRGPLAEDDKAKVMGGNLARLMNVGVPA